MSGRPFGKPSAWPAAQRSRFWRLGAIATAAGAFSGLFGVGGGTIGNVRLRDGLLVGILSLLGVLVGVALANAVSERALELSFAAVQLLFAWQLAKNAGLR
jgi:uncharacterized membrane protein YfcA